MIRHPVPMKKALGILLCSGNAFWLPLLASAHSSITNNKVWQVCENQARSDACEYTDNPEDIYRGTCQLMSEQLL